MNNELLNIPENETAEEAPSIGRIMNSLCPVISKENSGEGVERLISGMVEPLNQVIVFDGEKKDFILCLRLSDYWNEVTGSDASQDTTIRIFSQLTSVFFRGRSGDECEDSLLALLSNELNSFSSELCMTVYSAIKNAQDCGLLHDSPDWNTLNNNLKEHAKNQAMKPGFRDLHKQRGLIRKTWARNFKKENGGKQ